MRLVAVVEVRAVASLAFWSRVTERVRDGGCRWEMTLDEEGDRTLASFVLNQDLPSEPAQSHFEVTQRLIAMLWRDLELHALNGAYDFHCTYDLIPKDDPRIEPQFDPNSN